MKKDFSIIKNKFIFLILSLILIVLFVSGLLFDENTLSGQISFNIKLNNSSEETFLWDDGQGSLYVFLPSYASMKNLKIKHAESDFYIEGESAFDGMDCSSFELNKFYKVEKKGLLKSKSYKLIFMKSENVSSMHVTTVSGGMKSIKFSRDNSELSNIRIYNEKGILDYQGGYSDKIKGRGNTTWSLDKKPFTIKLEKEANLLGMGQGFDWVLLANGYDESNIRNKLVYDFASKFLKTWSPESRYIDLYINGEYMGLYLLTEKIGVSKERFKAGENGALIQLTQDYKIKDKDTVINYKNRNFILEYPYEINEKQLNELTNAIKSVDDALKNDDSKSLDKLIDIDSMAKKFLIDEVFLNKDEDEVSSYYYYDAEYNKLFAGPIWDYDLCLGNDAGMYTDESKDYKQILSLNKVWYKYLYENEYFKDYVIDLYKKEFRSLYNRYIEERTDILLDEINTSAKMNAIRWNQLKEKIYDNGIILKTHDSIMILKDFIKNRINFLDDLWLNDKYCLVTVMKDKDIVFDYVYVKKGETIKELPDAQEFKAADIIYWYLPDGSKYDDSVKIEDDMVIYPKLSFSGGNALNKLVGKVMENQMFILPLLFCGIWGILGLILLFNDIKINGNFTRKKDGGNG
ncbi:CotH protein [Acetitomaculum ruminis DSM 5522]|uniref:CotH protein n=1 Tax=Acetitomaculum ruminis DSM 5522 TaxID=1120918 RepID=A0A1I0Z4A9_9FIRM|nr:CotH kinase family protein [Acetitomaculum ruminis]SFB19278.1 CotH protein [Acetitomaculum ruminis DSM 5522]